MKEKFNYEMPMLVDLSTESAVGWTTCYETGNQAEGYHCNLGSCPAVSQCANGTSAQACYSVGSNACNPPANSNCKSCCFSGTGVKSGLTLCSCESNGALAGWYCTSGSKAAGSPGFCSSGGYYDYCY